MNLHPSSMMIENTELEKYSFNLIHYFLDKENYTLFNIEEKILENFNHDYYNVIYIYSSPLINDVNIENLTEKLTIIKQRLRKQFLLFNQSILVLATNSNLDTAKIDLPNNIDIINVTDRNTLGESEIIRQIFPDLLNYPLDLSFDLLSYKLNTLSIAYINKMNAIFNKKKNIVSIILMVLVVVIYLYQLFLARFDIPNFLKYFLMSHTSIANYQYYTLITNSFIDVNFLSVILSVFFLFTFGIKMEKIYGSLRFLGIILLTIIFSNSLLFAFIESKYYFTGFTPIVYTFVGAFIYVILTFRRFLAYMFKKVIVFNFILFIVMLIIGDIVSLISLIGALLSGFVSAFILGIPKLKNGNIMHRILALIFVFILISLSLVIGLK